MNILRDDLTLSPDLFNSSTYLIFADCQCYPEDTDCRNLVADVTLLFVIFQYVTGILHPSSTGGVFNR